MAKAAYNRLLSLSNIQLGPQKLNFAVTKIVTVLIFGIFCPQGPEKTTIRLPGTAHLFGNRRSMAPGAFHAAYSRGKPRRKVERALNSISAIVATLDSIEIAHQERS